MFVYPSYVFFFLMKLDKNSLYKEETIARIGNLYKGIHVKRHKYSIAFYPISIFRRFSFVFVLICFQVYSLKIHGLLYSSQAYLMIYMTIWPHENRIDVIMEITNEVILILSTYNIMLIANKGIELEFRFHLGTTMIALLSIITLLNIGVTTAISIQRFLTFRHYRQLK